MMKFFKWFSSRFEEYSRKKFSNHDVKLREKKKLCSTIHMIEEWWKNDQGRKVFNASYRYRDKNKFRAGVTAERILSEYTLDFSFSILRMEWTR